jgi:hypothetical protein
VIANAELLRKVVHNFKRQTTRRVQYTLRVNPATAPELAARVPERLSAIITAKDKVKFDHVSLTTMDQNFIEYDIVYNLTDANYGLFLQTQQAVLLETMAMLRELGISTAPRAQELLVQGRASNDSDGARHPDGRGQAQARPTH